jgi:hypothetical protein
MGSLVLPAQHSALAADLRFLQNTIGAIPSPFDCWLAHRGAKTMHLRMRVHNTNALAVAKVLQASPFVKKVVYLGWRPTRGTRLRTRRSRRTRASGSTACPRRTVAGATFPTAALCPFGSTTIRRRRPRRRRTSSSLQVVYARRVARRGGVAG